MSNINNVGGAPPAPIQGPAPANQTEAPVVPGQGNNVQLFLQVIQNANPSANAFAAAVQNIPQQAPLPAAANAAPLPPLLPNPPGVLNGNPHAVGVARRLYFPDPLEQHGASDSI
jgi:hypothetical protein